MKITKTEEKVNVKKIEKKISKKVFINLLIAIAIMAYFCILSVVYTNIYIDGIVGVVKVTTLVFLAITILLMEIAYKKESKTLFIHVIEILILSVHSLTTMHIVKIYNIDFKNYILASSYVFSIYYVLKTILINTKARRDYLKNMSDIPEIIKKEEPRKKEATKKEHIEKSEENIEQISKIQENEEKNIEKPQEEISTSEKIAGLKAKMEKLIEKEKNIKSKIKKNTEIKQEENQEKSQEPVETKEQKEENKEVEETPKPKRKRGRPKKEVKVND